MAEIKDKVVTLESLSALHEHNKNAYLSSINPNGNGALKINGSGNFTGSLTIGNVLIEATGDALNFLFLDEPSTTTSNEE